MKAVIVTPFYNYSYEVRIKYIENFLKEKGYECFIISSDFDHRNKKTYNNNKENLILLHVPRYKKNFSISRIYSHYRFSKKVYKKLGKMKPDLIYGSVPPNFLIKFISRYKRKNNNVKLFFEIGDLWPETLPIQKQTKKMLKPILNIWSNLRDRNLKYSNGVIYECNLFRDKISLKHCNVPSHTLYLCKKDFFENHQQKWGGKTNDVIEIAYIGSINNIIDIDLIVKFLNKLNQKKKVKLIVIGNGENKEKLLKQCNNKEIEIVDYGIIYNDKEKFNILKNCWFGLNIMKENVVVGMTMKSLEYFHWGLALINNIPGDSELIVKNRKCGFNINNENLDQIIENILEANILELKENSRKAYEEIFSVKKMEYKLEKIIES